MAKNAAVKAKAKEKAAAKIQPAPTVSKAIVESKHSLVFSPHAGKQTRRQRALERRNSDMQGSRAIKDSGRLAHIPERVWENARNPDNQTVESDVNDEIHRLEKMSPKGRLAPRFWMRLYVGFSLVPNVEPLLTKPDEDSGESDMAVLACLQEAHSDGSIDKRVAPIETYLRTCPRVSRVTLYGIIVLSLESGTITRMVATRIHVAILGYLARTVVVF